MSNYKLDMNTSYEHEHKLDMNLYKLDMSNLYAS